MIVRIILGFVIGLAGYIAVAVARGPGVPVLEAAESMDLGYVQKDSGANIDFVIRNAGRADLIVGDWKSSCACVQPTHKGERPANSITIKPGESFELNMALSIKKEVYAPSSYTLTYHTNDPSTPTAQFKVSYNPLGTIMAMPAVNDFGVTAPGNKPLRREVTIYTTEPSAPATIGNVSVEGSQFKIESVTPIKDAPPETVPYWKRPIAKMSILYLPSESDDAHSTVAHVFDSTNQKKAMLMLSGRTAHPLKVVPSNFAMAPGESKKVMVRFDGNREIAVKEITLPPGVRIAKRVDEPRFVWVELMADHEVVSGTMSVTAEVDGETFTQQSKIRSESQR